jgi:hypothetical protein
VLITMAGVWPAVAQLPTYGVGRPPTSEEVKVWNLTIPPDGEGLPPGSGTAARGQAIYVERCASCHGEKGEDAKYSLLLLVGGHGTLTTDKPIKTIVSFWQYATTLWYDHSDRQAVPKGRAQWEEQRRPFQPDQEGCVEEFRGLTAELYQALVAVVDDRLGEIRVTRESFDRLTQAISGLVEAQAQTAVRVGRLEEAMGRLTEGQRQLTEAQAQTAAALQQTQSALQQLARQVGGLSETVGGDIEDIAYIVLHEVLAREFGWQVGVLERTWQTWNGAPEEVNVFGQATDPTHPERPIWIVGEAKHNLTLREVERFARQGERARRHLPGEVFAVCFCYRARPEVRVRLKELGIPLLFSYGRFA